MTHPSPQRPAKASLFATCVIDQFQPEIGESAVRLLRRLGVAVDFNPAQTCCGQPAFNSGFWNQAKPLAKRVLDIYHQSEDPIVIPSGSCAAMIRVFYDELFDDSPYDLQRVQALKPRVFELSEFIAGPLAITNLAPYADSAINPDAPNPDGKPSADANAPNPDGNPNTDANADAAQAADDNASPNAESNPNTAAARAQPATPPLSVAYHEACHLRRELGATDRPRALIQSLPGVQLVEMEQSEVCCGFGGAFSVKYPEISGAMLQDKITFAQKSGAAAITASDASCLMHIGGGLRKQAVPIRPVHFATLMEERLSR